MPANTHLVLSLLLSLASILSAMADGNRPFVLVIDAGHGGHDPGALGAYSKEKAINLNVALAFGRLVEYNCPDVKVVYTRTRDVFIPLQRRADIANNHKADLFISIHTNALPGKRTAYGSETYSLGMARANANLEVAKRENSVITLETDYQHTYQGFDPNKAESYVIFEIMQDRYMKQSVDLASYIQKQYKAAGRPDKGVHQAGFLVLRNTTMPSVLTELGFISTPSEEAYLNSEQGIQDLSRSIYNGFLNYRRHYDRSAHQLPANLPTQEKVKKPDFSLKPRPDDNTETPPAEVKEPVTPPQEATPAKMQEETPETTAVRPTRNQATDRKPRPNTTPGQSKAGQPALVYRVQLGAGKRQIPENDAQFKGLKVKRQKEGELYKYYLAPTFTTHAEARQALAEAKKKMPAAYIVAFHNGRTISVTDARKLEGK